MLTNNLPQLLRREKRVLLVLASLVFTATLAHAEENSQKTDSIAYFGHGAMFDQNGREIVPSAEFIDSTQTQYRKRLLKQASEKQRQEYKRLRRKLTKGRNLDSQAHLLVNSYLLTWLIDTVVPEDSADLRARNHLMQSRLQYKLPTSSNPKRQRKATPFKIPRDVEQLLRDEGFSETPRTGAMAKSASNKRQDYIDQCRNSGVPIPPDWGSSQWVSQGPLNEVFISANLQAEVFTFQSSAPEGMCIALPRSTSNGTIQLLGIICSGKKSSKACFWDNQEKDKSFNIGAEEILPLKNFAGGDELNKGQGGTCTDCHAGENPYVIHPGTALDMSALPNRPAFGDKWYKPLVHKSWPQNDGPVDITGVCAGCHSATGPGGRFPRLSKAVQAYCGTILEQAIAQTMPPEPGDPGSLKSHEDVKTLQTMCEQPRTCTSDKQCVSPAVCKSKPFGKCVVEASKAMGDSCANNAECETGRCNKGKCVCANDEDCTDSQYCDKGFLTIGANNCVAKKANGKGCTRPLQCTSGRCYLGFCKEEKECSKDTDCDGNQYCDKGTLTVGKNQCVAKKSLGTACSRGGQCGSSCCKLYKFKVQCRPNDKCK